MSDFHVHSFDDPRERPAPHSLRGRSQSGEEISIEFVGPTLIVAVKPRCAGCRDFIHGDLHDFANIHVFVVSATTGDEEWHGAPQTVLIAPEFMKELGIRSAPWYVLIDPANSSVLGEGTPFSPAQVAGEVASFFTR